MCSICGCSIDPADESLFSKDYRCLDCSNIFKAAGVVLAADLVDPGISKG